jgi:hypothetical protein
MDQLDPLSNLDVWMGIAEGERRAVLDALATAMGAPWRAGRSRVGRRGLGELVHGGLGQGFVVVPGGWLRMGFSVDDVVAAAAAREEGGPHARWGWSIRRARPTRWIRMRPFLMAIAGLAPEGAQRATDGGAASEAYREAVAATRGEGAGGGENAGEEANEKAGEEGDAGAEGGGEPPMRTISPDEAEGLIPAGLRMPSEAEMEWVFREGGTTRWIGVPAGERVTPMNRRKLLLGELENGFGIVGFRDVQNLCADNAGDYDATSPGDQRPSAGDGERKMARWGHTMWQDDDGEMIAMHAANRALPDEYGDTILRLAADLPLAEDSAEVAPPGPLAEHALLLAALGGADARAHGDALAALGQVVAGPGHDLGPTAAALIAHLAAMPISVRSAVLIWLADAQLAGHRDATALPPERRRKDALPADRADVRAAVAAGADAIVAQLGDADPDVRSAAVLALTFCVDAPMSAKVAMRNRLAVEEVPGVRIALRLALPRLGAPVPGGDGAAGAAALAIAMAFDGPPDLDGLIAACDLGKLPHLAFADGQLGNVAIGILRTQDHDARVRAASVIATRAVREHDAGLAEAALEMLFGEIPEQGPFWPRTIDSLSVDERTVVEILAEVTHDRLPWTKLGLPPTVTGRRRALGLAPRGPADRSVPYKGDREPLAFALRHVACRIATGDAAATAEREAILAELPPVQRLVLFLDAAAHHLNSNVRGPGGAVDILPDDWDVATLMAQVGDDRRDARAEVDAFVQHPERARGGVALLEAVVATRAPGEPPDAALLDELGDDQLGFAADVLRSFLGSAVANRLRAAVRKRLDVALARDGWMIGVDGDVERWAPLLGHAPSPSAVRQMLVLGWASGQPGSVREVIGEHGAAAPAIAAVLAEYDALPEFTSWPAARTGLAAFLAPALNLPKP